MSNTSKTRLSIERRGAKNNKEYAYEITYHYDPRTKRTVTEGKRYLGRFLGYDDNNQPIIRHGNRGKTTSVQEELKALVGQLGDSDSVRIDWLRRLIADPCAFIEEVLQGELTPPIDSVEWERPKSKLLRSMSTISINIPVAGLEAYLNRNGVDGRAASLQSRFFLHLLLDKKDNEGLESVCVADGSHAPWRSQFHDQQITHSVLYVDPSRSYAQLAKNAHKKERIGVVSTTSEENSYAASDWLSELGQKPSKSSQQRFPQASLPGNERWSVTYATERGLPELSSGMSDFRALIDLSWWIARGILESARWQLVTAAKLRDRMPLLGCGIWMFAELLRNRHEGPVTKTWASDLAAIVGSEGGF